MSLKVVEAQFVIGKAVPQAHLTLDHNKVMSYTTPSLPRCVCECSWEHWHSGSIISCLCLFFPTEEYWQIGGHKAVRAKILEDVWLGIEINRGGGRHVAVDLSPVVSCHIYYGVRAIWEGATKWIYSDSHSLS